MSIFERLKKLCESSRFTGVVMMLLGVIALRVDGKLEWDAPKMRFTNNPEANKYLKPTFRKGWSLT